MPDNQTLTEVLAGWIAELSPGSFGRPSLEHASDLTLDWLGCALAGSQTTAGRAVLAYARRQPRGECRLLAWPESRSASVAAFANGALSHIVELDDVDRASVLHPATVVIPAALAIAERHERSGPELLAAILAGYEVAIRIGTAVGKEHYYYFHNTSTCGIFGAAAAAGALLDLSEEKLVWALGSAGTQAFGLWQFNEDGTMSKHLHAGRAAAAGVESAELAAHGFTGTRAILEGKRGFFAAMAPSGTPERIVQGLDRAQDHPLAHQVSLKPYPSCRHTHAAIDATRALKEKAGGKTPERISIETYQAALNLCDRSRVETMNQAKFSLQYCTAQAFYEDTLELSHFEEPYLSDERQTDWMHRVEIRVDPKLEATYPAAFPARVRAEFSDGSSLEETVMQPKGDPENAMSREEIESKFRRISGLTRDEADNAIEWVRSLENDERLLELPSLPSGLPAA